MSWQVYTAIILQRILLRNHKTDPVAYSVLFQLFVAAILLVVALATGFSLSGIGDVWRIALACIVLYGIGTVVYAKTLQRVEASVFSMLFATHAIWVMALGLLFFNESLTILQIVGSVLLFISVGMLVKDVTKIYRDKGTIYGLTTGVIYGFAVTGWAYVGREVDTITWAAVSFVGSAFISFLISPRSYKKMAPLLRGDVAAKMLLLAVFYSIGSLAMLLAYKYGTLSLVSPLRQTGIIVTTLLALVLLAQERNRIVIKIVAACISFAGVLLLTI